MRQLRRYISALAVTATAAAGLIFAAPAAQAASNPSIVTYSYSFTTRLCTSTSTVVRMNPGDAFTLHVASDSGSPLGFSVDGGTGFPLNPGQSTSISFAALGSHSITAGVCPALNITVVAEPVEAPPAHDYFQQVGVPASGSCADVPAWVGHWSGYPIGGWSKSWAQWIYGGRGGPVCTREVEERPDGTFVLIG